MTGEPTGGPTGERTRERRRKPRIKLSEICYIQIDPNNGGVVVDLSEDGLGFQAAAPVQQSGQVRFSFLSFLNGRVEAYGELAWISPDKKSGGLRFTNLPEAARAYVRELLESAPTTVAEEVLPLRGSSSTTTSVATKSATVLPPAKVPTGVPSSTKAPAPSRTTAPPYVPRLGAAPTPRVPVTRAGAAPDIPRLGAAPSGQTRGRSFSVTPNSLFGAEQAQQPAGPLLEELMAGRRQAFFRGLMTGIAVTALVAAGLWTFQNYLRRAGESLFGRGEMQVAAGKSANPISPSFPAPASQSNSQDASSQAPSLQENDARANTPAVPPSNPSENAPQASVQSSPANSSIGPDASEIDPVPLPVDPSDTGQAELDAAEGYLHGRNGAPDFRNAQQWLWAAVKKGNTQAEVELSDLYLKGDGVKKNCEQARVLLLAAAQKGNSVAREKLQSIVRNGCQG